MTPEEQQMLTDLANKIAQTPPPQRDAQAEEFIRTRIGSRPDALYLMTQTVLIQNLALEHAKEQIQQLQQSAAAVPGPGQPSGLLGGVAPVAPRGSGGWGSPQPSYATPPPAPPPQAPSAPASGGGSSFLRSAATTAAGVAAGALAFEGIRALFGGIEHLAGFGGGPQMGGGGFLGGGGAPSETIINNYYESPERSATNDTGTDDSDDSDDDNDSSDDTDDSSSDDSSYDDSSSSDDNLV